MSSTFFHELRTRQQLGYVVGAGNLPLNRHPGLIFYIQSPVAGPQILLDAVEEFIDLFPLAMLELTEQQWQDSKAGLQAQLSERDANLRSRGQRPGSASATRIWALISAKGCARRWAT
jgi:secreted Zn-dependent insulinase-like peptidase